jgi:predicted transcriptional regulator
MDTPVNNLIKDQKLILLNSTDTMEQALDTLQQANISSAPVLEDGKPVGFVDVLDILAFLIRTSTKPLLTLETAESRYLNTDSACMLKKRTKDFNLSHMTDLVDLSKRNPLIPIRDNQVFSEAIAAFVANRVHRLGVFDQNNNIKGVLTQSMVLRDLEPSLSEDPRIQSLLANNAKLTPLDNMVLVAPNCPAIDVYMTMYNNNSSAAGVIDGVRVVSNVSASDLKTPYAHDFSNLVRRINEWLRESRKSIGKGGEDYLVCCTQDTALVDVIHRINKERIHRIFVVDHVRELGTTAPLGVISLTDLLDTIAITLQKERPVS